ncbi:OTU domain-containing protein 6B [Entophlyctis sp. JEL0112]|nr:OTU domain-containing protein 6B [Entophlyctis sp. JEL0112]
MAALEEELKNRQASEIAELETASSIPVVTESLAGGNFEPQAKKAANMEEDRRLAALEASKTVNMKQLEEEAISKLLVPLHRRVKQVIADGHCLYNAVSDQYALLHESNPLGYQYFRKLAADCMRSHPDDFLPFLTNEGGDSMNEDQYAKYCDEVEHSAAWGGQLEVSNMH